MAYEFGVNVTGQFNYFLTLESIVQPNTVFVPL